jgi:sugar phosphate isomerase/epimerase
MAFSVRIGVDQFSYHRFFGEVTPWETDPGVRWTTKDFLDRVCSLQIGVVGLQTAYLDPFNVKVLHRELAERSLTCVLEWGHPDGLRMGKSKTAREDLEKWLSITTQMGARTLRVVAGNQTYRGKEPVLIQIERMAPLLRSLCLQAADCGVVLALENHADFTPAELMGLIRRVEHPNLRALFDTGNTVRLGAELIRSAQQIAPLTEAVHLKDLFVLPESLGNPCASWPSAPLGEGSFDIPSVLVMLQRHGFDGLLLIEMSHMHRKWPDEHRAVVQSAEWLKNTLKDMQSHHHREGVLK